MTRICYDKGAIKHDDRLDALAIAVAYWTERMAMDADTGSHLHTLLYIASISLCLIAIATASDDLLAPSLCIAALL
jgi:hypothetical protein